MAFRLHIFNANCLVEYHGLVNINTVLCGHLKLCTVRAVALATLYTATSLQVKGIVSDILNIFYVLHSIDPIELFRSARNL
jgi:hypothetical protein